MPVERVLDQTTDQAPASPGASSHVAPPAPLLQLHLWPHRSLPRIGFAWFIGITALLLALPLLPALGTPVLWGLLPFLLGALWLLWFLLSKSYRDGELLEELTLWPDLLRLSHAAPGKALQIWEENPHWVKITLHESGAPVPAYITLSGRGRTVELGRFLTEDERRALYDELSRLLPLRR